MVTKTERTAKEQWLHQLRIVGKVVAMYVVVPLALWPWLNPLILSAGLALITLPPLLGFMIARLLWVQEPPDDLADYWFYTFVTILIIAVVVVLIGVGITLLVNEL